MHLAVIGADGLLDLGNDARRAGFGPGMAVQVVHLSSGNLLVVLADDQSVTMDLSRLIEQHGRRALPRRSLPRKAQEG